MIARLSLRHAGLTCSLHAQIFWELKSIWAAGPDTESESELALLAHQEIIMRKTAKPKGLLVASMRREIPFISHQGSTSYLNREYHTFDLYQNRDASFQLHHIRWNLGCKPDVDEVVDVEVLSVLHELLPADAAEEIIDTFLDHAIGARGLTEPRSTVV